MIIMNEDQNNINKEEVQTSVTTTLVEQVPNESEQPETVTAPTEQISDETVQFDVTTTLETLSLTPENTPKLNNTIVSNQAESIGNEPISQIEKKPKKGISKLIIAIIILAILCAASITYYLTREDSTQTTDVEEELPVSDESFTNESTNYEKTITAEITANNKTYTIEYGINIVETKLYDEDLETHEEIEVTGYEASIDILLNKTKLTTIINEISNNKEDVALDKIDIGNVTTIKDADNATEYILFEIKETKWSYMGISKEVYVHPMIYTTEGKLITTIITSEYGVGSYWEIGENAVITEDNKYKYLVQNNSIIYLENQEDVIEEYADRVTLTIKNGEVSKETVQVLVDGEGQVA